MKARTFLLVVVASVTGPFVVGPWAFASFHPKAQGASSALISSYQPVTVAALVGGDNPSTKLQPGGSADVILRVSNSNSHPVVLISVVANGTITVSGASGTCTTPGVSFVDQTGLAVTIPASGTSLVHLANAASMSTASQSGCQGATFKIPVAITANEL